MCYIDFLILVTHAEGEGHLVFDDKFAFLQSGNGCANVVKFLTAYAEQVFDYFIVDRLLLHNLRSGLALADRRFGKGNPYYGGA